MEYIPKTSILLPDIRSGWNTGSFFRTADGLGIEHIFLSGFTPFPPHKEISKTAINADKFMSWTYFSSNLDAIEELQRREINIYALELVENAKKIKEVKFKFPMCLVVGNEITGVSKNILNIAKETVYIPMQGKKHSMNVSIAGSIAMWEMMKSYNK
jgi:tRNA G18 (ribose-2'-O)-methylase SpoU